MSIPRFALCRFAARRLFTAAPPSHIRFPISPRFDYHGRSFSRNFCHGALTVRAPYLEAVKRRFTPDAQISLAENAFGTLWKFALPYGGRISALSYLSRLLQPALQPTPDVSGFDTNVLTRVADLLSVFVDNIPIINERLTSLILTVWIGSDCIGSLFLVLITFLVVIQKK